MTTEEHDKIREFLQTTIRKIFEDGGMISPTVYKIENNQLEVYVIAEMPNDDCKDKVEQLCVKFVDDGAEGLGFASEAWMLAGEKWNTHKQYSCIADNPNRIEILMFTYSTKSTEVMAFAKIIREDEEDPWGITFTGEKKKPKLDEWDIHTTSKDGHKSEGRFAKFWEKARTLHYAEN